MAVDEKKKRRASGREKVGKMWEVPSIRSTRCYIGKCVEGFVIDCAETSFEEVTTNGKSMQHKGNVSRKSVLYSDGSHVSTATKDEDAARMND